MAAFNANVSSTLQALKMLNTNIAKVQNQMTTGKKINDARDDAAGWATVTKLTNDKNALEGIITGLQRTKAAVDVAVTAANNIVTAATHISQQVSAYSNPADATTVNTAINAYATDIDTYAATSYNGLSLLNNTSSNTIRSGLSRSSTNTVTYQNMTISGVGLNRGTNTELPSSLDLEASGTLSSAIASTIAANGNKTINIQATAGTTDGAITSVTVNGNTVTYTAATDDTAFNVANGLKNKIDALGLTGITTSIADPTGGAYNLTITNANSNPAAVISARAYSATGNLGTISGTLDVATLTANDVATAVSSATTKATELGNWSNRLGSQISFLQDLSSQYDSSIGNLSDADMEATAARLQSLQVQQQLAVQALSISNNSAQNLVRLFQSIV